MPAHWRPFFEFLAQTGLRIGEAIELRWKDIDTSRPRFQARRAFRRGKAGRPKSMCGRRALRLTPSTSAALAPPRGAGQSPVFAPASGLRLETSNVRARGLNPPPGRAGRREWVTSRGQKHA